MSGKGARERKKGEQNINQHTRSALFKVFNKKKKKFMFHLFRYFTLSATHLLPPVVVLNLIGVKNEAKFALRRASLSLLCCSCELSPPRNLSNQGRRRSEKKNCVFSNDVKHKEKRVRRKQTGILLIIN